MPFFTRLRKIPVLALVAALASLPLPAVADALDDAKRAGHVGERFDGYLGVVSSSAPSSARALVDDINAKRRSHYAGIAKREGTSTEAVAAIAGKKLVQRAAAGEYVLPSSGGDWVRR